MTLEEHFEEAWATIYPHGDPFPRGKEVAAVFFAAGVTASVGKPPFVLGGEIVEFVARHRRTT